MATFTITNIDTAPVHLGDFYHTLDVAEVLTLANRTSTEIPGLVTVMEALNAGTITFVVTYTAAEIASGFQSPPNAVEAGDLAEVAAAAVAAGSQQLYIAVAATGAGADDVTIYAANALPYKFRILKSTLFVATAAGTTAELRDEPAGAGTAFGDHDPSIIGQANSDAVAAGLVTPGATKGLFLRRDNGNSVGYLLIDIRRES